MEMILPLFRLFTDVTVTLPPPASRNCEIAELTADEATVMVKLLLADPLGPVQVTV